MQNVLLRTPVIIWRRIAGSVRINEFVNKTSAMMQVKWNNFWNIQ